MAKSTLADKRRWRKLRKEGLCLKAQLQRERQAIIDLVESQLPCNYRARFVERGQLVVENMDWLDALIEAQYRNASHWLNDRGLL